MSCGTLSNFSCFSEYGFAEKVVEGMSVRINSITIKVQARAFHASFELWQLQGNSLNPKWQRSDLRYTRITDPKRGEVLRSLCFQSLLSDGRSCSLQYTAPSLKLQKITELSLMFPR